MKVSLRVVLLVPVFVLSISVASAEPAFWTGSVPPAPQARTNQAREWLEGFGHLDRQIPTLSPTESAWLKKEYDDQIASAGGKFTKRAIAAADSTEYHKRLARQWLDAIMVDLLILSGSRQLNRQDEIIAWTRLAANMIDPGFWQAVEVLRERKVVSGDLNGVKEFLLENHVGWAQIVLARIVLPMMEGAKP